MHPDVSASPNAAEDTRRLCTAYALLLSSASANTNAALYADPFASPEAPATLRFVNELRCMGRGARTLLRVPCQGSDSSAGCSSSCVSAAPHMFAFAADTGAARVLAQGVASDYELRVAVGQCPTECIHYVTPLQLLRLAPLLQRCAYIHRHRTLAHIRCRARDGSSPDEVGTELAELLAQARYENGRERGPKRRPTSSTPYVDWFE